MFETARLSSGMRWGWDMFKVGDEVVCINIGPLQNKNGRFLSCPFLEKGKVYVVSSVGVCPVFDVPYVNVVGVNAERASGFKPERFRKAQRKNSRLTLEAFFTVPGGFEEPKRAPAKKKAEA